MSTTEGLQQQPWPDLDISYFRWEPPVFAGAPVDPQEKASKPEGRRNRVESAFAHSSFPTSFAGWDKVRAASEKAAAGLPGFPTATSSPAPGNFSAHSNNLGFPAATAALVSPQQESRATAIGPGPSSAFKSLRAEDKHHRAAPLNTNARNLSWPAEPAQAQSHTPPPQYGASFDGVFGPGPTGLRYGMPEGQSDGKQPASVRYGHPVGHQELSRVGNGATTVGQNAHPVLLVQCGKFAAPVQREAQQQQHQQRPQQHQPSGWTQQSGSQAAFPGSWRPRKSGGSLQQRPHQETDPLQLQEYYAAQSDILEELLRGNGQRDPGLLAAVQGFPNLQSSQELEPGVLDYFEPFGRATSVLDVPRIQPGSSAADIEPYMPQWQSESVPAELPNQVVNRLMMSGNGASTARNQRHSRRLSGTKRDWSGLQPMQSIPDGQELPVDELRSILAAVGSPAQHSRIPPESPDVDQLEELARTADVEVAHRAFLVPPHKKRGKGGRQPAADPRLDPSIDARRAKRILANRLSAARSKMKQKNQMDGLSVMVKQLEDHCHQLKEDAAELMEVCEETEFENRRLAQQAKILEEFGRRQLKHHSTLVQKRSSLNASANSKGPQDGGLFLEGGQAMDQGASPARKSGNDRLAAENSTDSLLKGLGSCIPTADGLLDYSR